VIFPKSIARSGRIQHRTLLLSSNFNIPQINKSTHYAYDTEPNATLQTGVVIPGVHLSILYLLPLPLHFNYVPFRFPPLARDRGSVLNLVSYPSYTTFCSILLHSPHPQIPTRHDRTTLTNSLEKPDGAILERAVTNLDGCGDADGFWTSPDSTWWIIGKTEFKHWPGPIGVLDITLPETFTPTLHQSHTFPFHDFTRQLSLYKLRETREGVVFELLLTPTLQSVIGTRAGTISPSYMSPSISCSSLHFYIHIHTQHA
jgi:hypothetical protein